MGLILVGCGELPRPFAHSSVDAKNPLLALPDSEGVKVEKISGAPENILELLAERLAEGLRKANIAATTASEFSGGYILSGEMAPLGSTRELGEVTISWSLRDVAGDLVGAIEQKVSGDKEGWRRADPKLVDVVIAGAVPAIASFLQDARETPVPADGKPLVSVGDIEGAPGGGVAALKRALAHHLGQGGLKVQKTPTTGTLVIEGSIQVSDLRPGEQRLGLVWVVRDDAGKELGKVRQASGIPAGALNRPWGDLAFAIAGGASSGIIDLIERSQAVSP